MFDRHLECDILAPQMDSVRFSMGITAHNEEANIGILLKSVLQQELPTTILSEIIVVISGCTDNTEGIVRDYMSQDCRIQLLIQQHREGKASAMNLFMENANEEILILSSADLQPAANALESLVSPFADPEIGLTACRPEPINDPDTFMGFAAHLLWNLHHQMNLQSFKAGEMIAFRKVFNRIPSHTAVDEACVEPLIRGQGYGIRYIPEAVVYNKGPETVSDFFRQRRRIYAGHLELQQELGYSVSTMSGFKVLTILLRNLDWRPKQFLWTWVVVALEMAGRLLGWIDFKQRRQHTIWDIAKTTKELETEI